MRNKMISKVFLVRLYEDRFDRFALMLCGCSTGTFSLVLQYCTQARATGQMKNQYTSAIHTGNYDVLLTTGICCGGCWDIAGICPGDVWSLWPGTFIIAAGTPGMEGGVVWQRKITQLIMKDLMATAKVPGNLQVFTLKSSDNEQHQIISLPLLNLLQIA